MKARKKKPVVPDKNAEVIASLKELEAQQDITSIATPFNRPLGVPTGPVMNTVGAIGRGLQEGLWPLPFMDFGEDSGKGSPTVKAGLETAAMLGGMLGMPGPDVPLPELKALPKAMRELRAKVLGFDVAAPVYHGTTAEIPEFLPVGEHLRTVGGDMGIHVGSVPEQANRRLMSGHPTPDSWGAQRAERFWGSQVMPLFARKGKVAWLPDLGSWSSADEAYSASERVLQEVTERSILELANKEYLATHRTLPRNIFPPGYSPINNIEAAGGAIDEKFLVDLHTTADRFIDRVNKTTHAEMSYVDKKVAWADEFSRVLERHGYESVGYPNVTEGAGEASFMFMKPEQLRSVFANFDPAKIDSPDLLASLAALGAGAGATVAALQPPVSGVNRRKR